MVWHRLAPVESLADRHLDHFADMQQFIFTTVARANPHRQRFGPQAIAAAGAAGAVILIAFELLAHPITIGFAVAPLHVGNDPFEHPLHLIDATALVIAEGDLLLTGAVEEDVLHLLREVFPARLLVKIVMFRNGFDGLLKVR